MIPFDELKVGMHAKVVQFDRTNALTRLMEMGFTPGAEFTVLKVAPFGDPIEIDLRGYRLCIRKAEMEGVEIEIIR
ncbi:MAG: ferrous iron transport protein A [Armatimonadetes bacterium]|nr:ferrous iron transport protein A [Armatimonadota bacterium]